MTDTQRPRLRLLGLQLLLVGVCVNRLSLAYLFSSNEDIEGSKNLMMIYLFQGLCIVIGGALLLGAAPLRLPTALRHLGATVGLLVWATFAWAWMGWHGAWDSAEMKRQTDQISLMNASESVHLKLTERVKKLSKSLHNLKVPSGASEGIFLPEVKIRDIASADHSHVKKELETVDTTIREWEVEEGTGLRTVKLADLDLLRPFLDQAEYVENGKFGFIGGDFVDGDMHQWEVQCYFKSLIKTKQGTWSKAKGDLKMRWRLDADADPHDPEQLNDKEKWHLSHLVFEKFKTIETPAIFFEETLDAAVPDAATLAAARRNIAQEMIVEKLKWNPAEHDGQEWEDPHEFWGHMASWRHPGMAVVDLDRDGWDDFYSMARYGRNLFFRNNGDGTFTEIAEDIGLDVVDHSAMAMFADFDNDGDDDLFLGRTLARTQYLENRDGKFTDRSNELFGERLPYFCITAATADYDLDGLLDTYLGTYGAQVIGKDLRNTGKGKKTGKVLDQYLPEEQAVELFKRYKAEREHSEHSIRDRVGPPNVLVRNTGGGSFEVVEDTPLTHYRNTFQSTFADYDEDGDPDIYVANDFAPNYMFRNDGGKFVDVTDETQAADIGFGMGISWGDFDRDGDQDAYVSNMFSKAGNRILTRVDGLNSTFLQMAAGNSLLELDGGKFKRISTTTPGNGMMVELAGWSWGSQFVDFDNDSWLDVYALSGHYSAPEEIRAGADL
jgi:hypothetical protein